MEEAFRVIDPDGKTYRIWADGRIEGFAQPAIVNNGIPALLRRYSANQSDGSPLPTRYATEERLGTVQGRGLRGASTEANSLAASGVK